MISGKSPAASPAATPVPAFRSGTGPGPMSELMTLVRLGTGPGGDALADGLGDAERVDPPWPVPEPEPDDFAAGVALDDAAGVGLAVGTGDVDRAGLALGVGVSDGERVGLGVDDAEGVGLALAAGSDVDGDGLGVSAAVESVLGAVGEAEGEETAALANADSRMPSESAGSRRAPVTKPATTARQCVTGMRTPLPLLSRRTGNTCSASSMVFPPCTPTRKLKARIVPVGKSLLGSVRVRALAAVAGRGGRSEIRA